MMIPVTSSSDVIPARKPNSTNGSWKVVVTS
jgi:hypothetical protein